MILVFGSYPGLSVAEGLARPDVMDVLTNVADALRMAFAMFWEILWALVLGFFLSAVVQAVVSKSEMNRLLYRRLGQDARCSVRIGCGVFLVFLCGRGSRTVSLSKRSELHGRYSLSTSLDQLGDRARNHYDLADGLAIRRGRISRRAGDDCNDSAVVPPPSQQQND